MSDLRDAIVARVTFLGDTLLGGEAQPILDARGAAWALDGIRPLLARSDLVVANHEGPITSRAEPESKLDTGRKRYWYRALPECVEALVEAKVRVVSLGNNHVLDFGASGLGDTIDALAGAGIAHCGAGPNRAVARKPACVEVNGLRLGFLSFMQRYDLYAAERLYATRSRPGPQRLQLSRACTDLARLDGGVDLKIALVHWGRNYRKCNPRQERLAAALRSAGAELIVGHHPHIPHPVTIEEGAPVFYSLGNGPLGTPGRFHSGRPPYGLVASVDLDAAARPRRLTMELIHVDNARVNFQPVVADGAHERRLLRKLLPWNLPWEERPDEGFVADLPGAARASAGSGHLWAPTDGEGQAQ